MRLLTTLIATICTATILAQLLAFIVLWQRGYVNMETLREVRDVVRGDAKVEPAIVAVKEETPMTPSFDEVQQLRLKRLLQLDARENELNLLKTTTTATANELILQRQAFDEKKQKFQADLEALQLQVTSESTEQTRAVLLAMTPQAAVERLMGLTLEDDLDLLKGMPEKTIAKLLQEFRGDTAKVERGRKLFEALKKGLPNSSLVNSTLENTTDGKD